MNRVQRLELRFPPGRTRTGRPDAENVQSPIPSLLTSYETGFKLLEYYSLEGPESLSEPHPGTFCFHGLTPQDGKRPAHARTRNTEFVRKHRRRGGSSSRPLPHPHCLAGALSSADSSQQPLNTASSLARQEYDCHVGSQVIM